MTERPPSPSTPTATPAIGDSSLEERVLATTPQLTDSIEDWLGYRLDETVLEDLLLELDRREYVEWVTVTQRGTYVWDLTESPDRIGDAVAEAVVDRLQSWLEGDGDE